MTGSARRGNTVSFTFEGRSVECREGVSVAAALAGAGEFRLRSTNAGDERGVFCGMGVCHECRVNVDGQHGVRACVTRVTPGSKVCRDSLPVVNCNQPASTVEAEDGRRATKTAEPDLLVIGGGAGGLTAASIAAEAGADVVLLDERTARGGQYFKQPAHQQLLHDSLAGDLQITGGRQLVERATNSGAKIMSNAQVWGAFAPAEFAVLEEARSTIYRPRHTIVATGAYERGLPIPGWTLPGVMTTGAAQGMLRNYGNVPAGRIVVAGNGPLNLQIALELKRAGADVRLVAELADVSLLRWMTNGLRMVSSVPKFAFDGIGYLRGLGKANVPVRFGQCLTEVAETEGGLAARIATVSDNIDDHHEIVVADVVCVGYGFQPSNEILRCLGCSHSYDKARGHLVTERSEVCETTVPGVYAVGDCAGFSGAPAAIQDGTIAAHAILRSLGCVVSDKHAAELRDAQRDRPRHRAFQAALWTLFDAPRFSTQLATESTLICRCENVSLGDVGAAVKDGATSLAAIKQRTRLGMGPCQGRYCAPVAADLLAERSGQPVDEYSFFAPRPPLKPVRIGDITDCAEIQSPAESR